MEPVWETTKSFFFHTTVLNMHRNLNKLNLEIDKVGEERKVIAAAISVRLGGWYIHHEWKWKEIIAAFEKLNNCVFTCVAYKYPEEFQPQSKLTLTSQNFLMDFHWVEEGGCMP